MLITLIVVPLVAVFGKSLPDYAQAWWRGREISANWESHPKTTVNAPKTDSVKEQFIAQSHRNGLQDAPRANTGLANANNSQQISPLGNVPQMPSLVPTNTNAPNAIAAMPQPPAASPLVNNSNAQLENRITDINVAPASLRPGVPLNAQQPVSQADSFQTLEKQLRESGATYYKLEATPQGYHFYCQATGAAQDIREYQAASATPVAAMQDVLRQLETGRRLADPNHTQVGAVEMRSIQ
jgi:hypothetical protein